MSRPPADDGPADARYAGSRYRPSGRVTAFVALLAVMAGAFLYDLLVLAPNAPLLDEAPWPFDPYSPDQLDWMLAFSLVTVGYWTALPLLRRPRLARLYARRFRRDPPALVSLLIVVLVTLVGLVGPFLVTPELNITASYQPPVFATVDTDLLANCLGAVVEDRCHGTFEYPLGTTFEGRDVLEYTIVATRTPVAVGLVAGVVIVPVAVLVGTVSAYFGGWVDGVLMRLVEVVQVVPPLIVYVVLRVTLGGGDVFMLVAVFGLLSWASVARLVRNRALSYREELFVTAAESAGGSQWYVTRRHVLPNLTATVVTATTLQIPNLILTEVALSFLDLGVPSVRSWGTIIADGTVGTRFGSLTDVWWISLVPVIALTITVVALSVLGDRLQDVLDPRAN